MTSILEKALHTETGSRRIAPSPFSVVENVYDVTKPEDLAYRLEFLLEVKLRVNYYCTAAERCYAYKNAQKVLLQSLYAESLRDIAMMRTFIYGGQQAEALSLLDKIQEDMGL